MSPSESLRGAPGDLIHSPGTQCKTAAGQGWLAAALPMKAKLTSSPCRGMSAVLGGALHPDNWTEVRTADPAARLPRTRCTRHPSVLHRPRLRQSARQPMISLSPSITRASSSTEVEPNRSPIRSTASVRIWLILTHDCFGRVAEVISRLNG